MISPRNWRRCSPGRCGAATSCPEGLDYRISVEIGSRKKRHCFAFVPTDGKVLWDGTDLAGADAADSHGGAAWDDLDARVRP